MFNKCLIKNCGSRRKNVKMHSFSKLRYKKWLQSINSDDLKHLSLQQLQKLCICHKHFEKRFIHENNRLTADAYPSLFSEDEIISGIPSKVYEDEKSSTSHDHDYYRKRKHNDHNYTSLSDDHQLTSTLSTANDGNVTDNHQMASISDTENDRNVTDNHQVASISDRANDGNVTDNHQMASISERANDGNVTENHQMASISDTANEENVIDDHEMTLISDTANDENVTDDHEMTPISDTANDENVTDDHEMTSISDTANDENVTGVLPNFKFPVCICEQFYYILCKIFTGQPLSMPTLMMSNYNEGNEANVIALELHTELVESGKELPQLREFFSNPGNFEQHVSRASEFSSMHRTPSQATLDSLDTARYSEDGGGDRGGSGGDVAVLEFELRKARETINSLRANLTQFADGESTLDKSVKDLSNQRSLKPHEKRALNFLINEYLLLQDYKLTSITFSDENPDQEFEDWDDVGLNMPRPAGLVSLFRGNTSSISPPKVDVSTETDWSYTEVDCQTDLDEGNICISFQRLDQETDWSHELLIQAEEIELLKQKIIALETEKLNFQKLYDAAIVSLNSLTSPASEGKGLDLHIPQDKLLSVQKVEPDLEANPITCMAAENHYGSGNSTHSATPEQFEMIDSEKNSAITRKGSNISSFEATGEGVIGDNSTRDSPLRRGSVTTLDETLSINDAGEWTRVQYEYNSIETNSKEMWIDSGIPNQLKVSILNWCCETLNLNEPLANDLLAELVSSDKPITLPGLLTLVADTLPRILPHTLVARRGEAVALVAAAAGLLPAGDARRARALHALLTLLKRPDAAGTRAICEATCLVVKWGGSGEVLSSIAELLASKSIERRVLASQVCMAIAPYVPIELCTSLLLSLVILMCESNELEIRTLGLKSACLICPVADHKYSQLESLMFNFLKDPVEKCVKDTVNIFVPVLARSALIAGKFSTDLCSRIMKNLMEASSDNEWKTVLLYLDVMRVLVLAKLAYVVNVQIVRDVTLSNCDMQSVNLQEVPLEETEYFMELQCYVTDNVDAKILLVAANNIIKEKPEVRWAELSWFISTLKQILDVVINTKVLSHTLMYEVLISLVNGYVENFGLQFTKYILKPIFTDVISELEQKMEKLHPVYADTTIVVGIYLVAILPALDDTIQHCEFLQKWIMYSSIRGLPVKIFSVPLKWVAEHREDSLDFYLQHLREFAASSCETTSGASVRMYIANLITDLLNATELSEKCIERQMLPAVMALLHDEDVSVREEAISSWGSVTRTCLIRGLDCEAQCWAPVEDMLGGNQVLTVKEAARTAEALALLVLPTVDNHAVSEKAVSLLCALCGGALCRELLSSLTPGLQLAVHHCRHHPALLPALRKLEEGVQAPALSQYKAAIEALIHNVAGTGSLGELAREQAPRSNTNLQAAQEVGRRVTQMFQQSKSNMNLQNIFKKKT